MVVIAPAPIDAAGGVADPDERIDMPKRTGLTPLQMVERRIEVDPGSGCWLYTGRLNDQGYAIVQEPRPSHKTLRGHRLIWQRDRGPIPEGMHLHHTCRRRNCVNPAHLMLLTPTEHSEHHTGDACRRCGGADWYYNPTTGARTCRPCHTKWCLDSTRFPIAVCAWCGASFPRRKGSRVKCCSLSCGHRLAWANGRRHRNVSQ